MEKQEEEGEYFGKKIRFMQNALFARFSKRVYQYLQYHISVKHFKHFKHNGSLFIFNHLFRH